MILPRFCISPFSRRTPGLGAARGGAEGTAPHGGSRGWGAVVLKGQLCTGPCSARGWAGGVLAPLPPFPLLFPGPSCAVAMDLHGSESCPNGEALWLFAPQHVGLWGWQLSALLLRPVCPHAANCI